MSLFHFTERETKRLKVVKKKLKKLEDEHNSLKKKIKMNERDSNNPILFILSKHLYNIHLLRLVRDYLESYCVEHDKTFNHLVPCLECLTEIYEKRRKEYSDFQTVIIFEWKLRGQLNYFCCLAITYVEAINEEDKNFIEIISNYKWFVIKKESENLLLYLPDIRQRHINILTISYDNTYKYAYINAS
jgi:hypothetical protein